MSVTKCAKWISLEYFFQLSLCGLLSVVLLLGCYNSQRNANDETTPADSADIRHVGDADVVDPIDTGGVSGSEGPLGVGGTGGSLGTNAGNNTGAGDDNDAGDDVGGSGYTAGTGETGDGGAEERVKQDPITFIIYNDTAQTKYLYAGSWIPIACEVENVEELTSCFQPDCTESCHNVIQNKIDKTNCGYVCDLPPPDVTVLEPEQSVQVLWKGKTYTYDKEICDGLCFWENDPFAGEFRISVETYNEYTCDLDSCPTNIYDNHSEILGARTQGEPQAYEAYFSVPFAEDTVTITIDDSQCTEESRGQVQCADYCGSDEMIQPICVQGHWGCAAGQVAVDQCPPDTCWGPPGICP